MRAGRRPASRLLQSSPRASRARRSARPRPLRGTSVLSLAIVAAALCGVTGAAAARGPSEPRPGLEAPQAGELRLAAAIDDATLPPRLDSDVRARLSTSWGLRLLTQQGEMATIRVSDAYPQDPSRVQRWANFLGTLVHGPELSSLTVYLAPLTEVQSLCGFAAVACYSAQRALAVVPGEDPGGGTSAEAVLAHEYGHHVAANRVNPPWSAVDRGTKRWASYVQVCRRTRAGELFPGAENPFQYERNPGEGFAEAYRLLNERRAGRVETPWEVVDRSLYPDDTALALLEQDVVSPWTRNTSNVLRGSFARAGTSRRTFTTTAGLDGTLAVTLRAPARARLSLAIVDAGGRVVSRSARTRAGSATARATTTICGARSFRLRVTRTSGSGSFQLTVSKP